MVARARTLFIPLSRSLRLTPLSSCLICHPRNRTVSTGCATRCYVIQGSQYNLGALDYRYHPECCWWRDWDVNTWDEVEGGTVFRRRFANQSMWVCGLYPMRHSQYEQDVLHRRNLLTRMPTAADPLSGFVWCVPGWRWHSLGSVARHSAWPFVSSGCTAIQLPIQYCGAHLALTAGSSHVGNPSATLQELGSDLGDGYSRDWQADSQTRYKAVNNYVGHKVQTRVIVHIFPNHSWL